MQITVSGSFGPGSQRAVKRFRLGVGELRPLVLPAQAGQVKEKGAGEFAQFLSKCTTGQLRACGHSSPLSGVLSSRVAPRSLASRLSRGSPKGPSPSRSSSSKDEPLAPDSL